MKESIFTGEQIHRKVEHIRTELKELREALDEVAEGTLPHRILKEQSEAKSTEYHKALRKGYTPKERPGMDL